MGADLYIKDFPYTHRGFEVSERAVKSGYFRDCYNQYGLFAVVSATLKNVELSWWRTVDRKELFTKEGDMTVEGAKIFLAELTPIFKKFKKRKTVCTRELIFDKPRQINQDGTRKYTYKYKQNGDKEKIEEYRQWADNLLTFLTLAIDNNKQIEWSV